MAALEGFRMSPQQLRVWALRDRVPAAELRVTCEVRISGSLDLARLELALDAVVAEHEILRTAIVAFDGLTTPLQMIGERRIELARMADLRALDDADLLDRIDLAGGRPLVAAVAPVAATEHVLRLEASPYVADAAGLRAVVAELARHYAGEARTDEPLQYADLSEWQYDMLSDEESVDEARRECFDAAEPSDASPWTSRFGGSAGGAAGIGRVRIDLDAADVARLDRTATRLGATRAEIALACWAALAVRHADDERPVLAVVSEGRTYPGLADAAGPFAKHLPIRIDADRSTPFADLARRVVAATARAAAVHELYATDCETSGAPERHAPYAGPAFEAVRAVAPVAAGAVTFAIDDERSAVDVFDVKLVAVEGDEGVRFDVDFARSRATEAWARALAAQLLRVLAAAASDEHVRVGEIALGEEDDATPSSTTVIDNPNVPLLVARHAAERPDALAVDDGPRWMTYAELDRSAAVLARRLRDAGIGVESRVGVLAERSVDAVVGIVAILAAGAAFVPLDPASPERRLSDALADAGAAVLLAPSRHLALAERLGVPAIAIEPSAEHASLAEHAAAPAGSAAYVIFTSGSTGRPKGVVVDRASLANYLAWVDAALFDRGVETIPALSALTFDASLKQIFAPLVRGGSVRIVAPETTADPAALVERLASMPALAVNAVPSLWRALLAHLDGDPHAADRLDVVRVLLGGERLPAELVARTRARFPRADVVNLYGPTETTANATAAFSERDPMASIGSAIAGARVYVRDGGFARAGVGIRGEICVGGPGVARGYLGLPAVTAERFVPDPFATEPGARLYRTGDLGRRRPDGALDFVGRGDRQVKVRGVRVEPGEIELALASHGSVADAVVAVRATGDDLALAAFVALRAGEPPVDADALRRHLRRLLPEAMVPASVRVVDALPRTPHGKVDVAALLALAPVAAPAALDAATPTEEILRGIWADVLGREDVGLDANFFDLGGHSLVAARVVSGVRAAFGVDLPLRDLFSATTVRALGGAIDEAVRGGRSVVDAIGPTAESDSGVLSLDEEAVWSAEQLDPGTSRYNVPAVLRLQGGLDERALAASIRELVARHEALRTRFVVLDGVPSRVVERSPNFELEERDGGATLDATLELVRREANRPFDLEHGPLVRAVLWRLGASDHIAMLAVHHAVCDGWSMRVLVDELRALYAGAIDGEAPALAPLPIRYADYAAWQRAGAAGAEYAARLDYWRGVVGSPPPAAVASLLRATAQPGAPAAGRVEVALDAALTSALKAAARAEGVTLFMAALTWYSIALSALTGARDLVIGTDVANRDRVETQPLVGLLVNQIPLRVRLDDDAPLGDAVRAARAEVLAAYANKDVPFGEIVRLPSAERSGPLFQAKLAFRPALARDFALAGLAVTVVDAPIETPKVELFLGLDDDGSRIRGTLEYRRDVVDDETAARIVSAFEDAAALAVEASDATVGEIVERVRARDEARRSAEAARRRDEDRALLRGARRARTAAQSAEEAGR